MRYLAVALLPCLLVVASAFRSQRVTVSGRVFCQSNPEKTSGVKIKLMDYDFGPDPDDLLDEVVTGPDGSFHLSGSTRELGRIDPRLMIYHDCNDAWRPCQREWKFYIPKMYINGDTFKFGDINLDMKIKDEDHDCVH